MTENQNPVAVQVMAAKVKRCPHCGKPITVGVSAAVSLEKAV